MSANTASEALALSDRMKTEMPEAETHTIAVRTLKIEADGDKWKGLKPKIRLMGYWLERAGFKPGHRVRVICVTHGVIELRFTNASPKTETSPTSSSPQ